MAVLLFGRVPRRLEPVLLPICGEATMNETVRRTSDLIDPDAPMCQCGHTRESHGTPSLLCWGCGSDLPCDAPGVTVKRRDYTHTWTWNLRCQRHGTLQINGPIDDWEPDAVTDFRREHAGH